MRGPTDAAKLIDKYVSFDTPPRSIRTVLESIIEGEEWARGDDIGELAERWFPQFVQRLKSRVADESKNAIASGFEFNSANDKFVQGSCFVEPCSTPEEADAKASKI